MNINPSTINALFGQSYNLLGKNSFAEVDATNTGLQSGSSPTGRTMLVVYISANW
jgi:hypothetical protein